MWLIIPFSSFETMSRWIYGKTIRYGLSGFLLAVLLAACTAPRVTQSEIELRIIVDGGTQAVHAPAGSTVGEVLTAAKITLNPTDRSDPPLYTVATNGAEVRVIRVEEELLIDQVVIPYEQQILRNESLPQGERRLVQPGVNGLQEITTRRVFEDGVEVSNSPLKVLVVEEPVPEIVMVGSQSPYAAIPIPGTLAYLSSGNAWVMEGSTGVRRPVVTTGDLDGRVFRLSPDGEWLLFTRREESEDVINRLWVAPLADDGGGLIDLEVTNVIHFADWSPVSRQTVAYSTVEPRATAPGWQANNDLSIVTFNSNGWISRRTEALEANSGGIYGWWGSQFYWAPDGRRLAYARPDSIGVVDLREEEATSLLEITPLQTNSDWAWVPGLAWGPDGQVLFTVDHAPPEGVVSAEESPFFELKAIPLQGGAPFVMLDEVGMFAYPSPSPLFDREAEVADYQVAYLQAIFPAQSDTSRYHLVVMDRDGSNRRRLFPPEGAPGLEPQAVVWSPDRLPSDAVATDPGFAITVLYQDNLWLIAPESGESWQLTGDNLVSGVDWK